LKNLQPDVRTLVIILEAEAMLIGGHQMVFQKCFKNTNEDQMVSCFSNKVDHYFWLQGPFIYLGEEWRANYIAVVFHQILQFLHV
jgi:hypothetical protein